MDKIVDIDTVDIVDIIEIVHAVVMVGIVGVVNIDIVDFVDIVDIVHTVHIVDCCLLKQSGTRLSSIEAISKTLVNHLITLNHGSKRC